MRSQNAHMRASKHVQKLIHRRVSDVTEAQFGFLFASAREPIISISRLVAPRSFSRPQLLRLRMFKNTEKKVEKKKNQIRRV